ncbi:hypothetical protein [Escherichia coli]|uniref:hypothetical protein n=1 Tax=Escherichia TaxID=561 RepID=UPI003D9C7299
MLLAFTFLIITNSVNAEIIIIGILLAQMITSLTPTPIIPNVNAKRPIFLSV